ncbi:WXG100-like domain-containing protein [Actinokineospora sp.]|uniref:WXG100-like domain-containing protein n=1 Tax=Actinokineospora sp. TaxID=1872133 RepID=UPI004037922F
MIGGWPDSDEDQLTAVAGAWDAAAGSAQSALDSAKASATATATSWLDSAGSTLATALSTPTQTTRVKDEFGRLAGQTRHFAGAVLATKSAIADTMALNEHLYQLALVLPGSASQLFVTAVAGHLNGVIDQQVAEVAGYSSAHPAAYAQGEPGAADLAAARDVFFGQPPPGAQRMILQTGAIVPGGGDGIIVSRFFIADEGAAFGLLHGDGRGPSTDPNAGHRFSVAWDTRTGEVSLTVLPSTRAFEDHPIGAHPINTDPGGSPNNFIVHEAGPDRLNVEYNVLNSGVPVPVGEANGRLLIELEPDGIHVSNRGDDYPDGEFIQYRDSGTRLLGSKEMSPWKETSPVISDAFPGLGQNGHTRSAPR